MRWRSSRRRRAGRAACGFETLVASPGRQAANAGELVRALEGASGAPVRVLGREEEALLGYQGAVAAAGPFEGAVAVCDVGGGSTQLAIGLPDRGPSWLRSFDIGSLSLTTAALDADPPGKSAVKVAREHVEREFDGLVAPLPRNCTRSWRQRAGSSPPRGPDARRRGAARGRVRPPQEPVADDQQDVWRPARARSDAPGRRAHPLGRSAPSDGALPSRGQGPAGRRGARARGAPRRCLDVGPSPSARALAPAAGRELLDAPA